MNKRILVLLVAVVCLMMIPNVAHAQFKAPGWNMGNTLESTWGYTMPTQALINEVHAAGFNTIRIPCAWVYNSTNGTINSSYMTEVTNVVNWALADGMYVVINEHWDNGWFEDNGFGSYSSTLNAELLSYWKQVAANFKNTSTNLSFACANEPDAESQAETNVLFEYYQNWVTAIRATGGNNASRYLIVEGPGGSNIGDTYEWVSSSNWPTDPDKKLALEVHYYDPYQFTLMTSDQSWGDMFYFWGSAYHTSKELTNRNATWGEESWLKSQFGEMQTKFVASGIPVYVGEYRAAQKPTESDLSGKYITQNYNSATYWNYYVENSLATYGLHGTCWDTPSSIFNWSTGAVVDSTMLKALLGKSYVAPISGL